jgi:hypothetical protein
MSYSDRMPVPYGFAKSCVWGKPTQESTLVMRRHWELQNVLDIGDGPNYDGVASMPASID